MLLSMGWGWWHSLLGSEILFTQMGPMHLAPWYLPPYELGWQDGLESTFLLPSRGGAVTLLFLGPMGRKN